MAREPSEYVKLAMSTSRSQFVAACPFPFLYGAAVLDRPMGPTHTRVGERGDSTQLIRAIPEEAEPEESGETLLLAVRKVKTAFPSMITVGRTANNDLMIADVNVSKFHAWFRLVPGRPDALELSDAGSRNGTFVAGRRLPPKGAPVQVALGGQVRFGQLAFTVVGPATAWDQLHDSSDW